MSLSREERKMIRYRKHTYSIGSCADHVNRCLDDLDAKDADLLLLKTALQGYQETEQEWRKQGRRLHQQVVEKDAERRLLFVKLARLEETVGERNTTVNFWNSQFHAALEAGFDGNGDKLKWLEGNTQ